MFAWSCVLLSRDEGLIGRDTNRLRWRRLMNTKMRVAAIPTSTTGSTTAGTMVLIFEWLLVIFRWLRGACNLSRRGLSRWLREWARSIHTRRSFSVNDSQMMFHFSCLWRSYNIFGILIKISYWSNFRRFLCSVSQCKSRLCKRRISPVCWMKQGKLSEHHTTLIVT